MKEVCVCAMERREMWRSERAFSFVKNIKEDKNDEISNRLYVRYIFD